METKKKYTEKEKLAIIKEGEESEVKVTGLPFHSGHKEKK